MPVEKDKLRWLEYEYMNRDIVWNTVSNFITFLFPFVTQLKNFSLFQKVYMFTTILGPLAIDLNSENEKGYAACSVCSDYPPNCPVKLKR